MPNPGNPSIFARLGGLVLFLAITFGCLIWFVESIYSLIHQSIEGLGAIYFDKGAMYMLGAGVALAALTFNVLYEGILNKNLTDRVAKIITRSTLTGLLLMPILPQLLHYSTNQYLTMKGYKVCVQASYQWLLYRKIAYTLNKDICTELSKAE